MSFFLDEALLEPIARWFRFQIGAQYLPNNKDLIVADLGCGPAMRFLQFCERKQIDIQKYFGVDPLINKINLNKIKSKAAVELVSAPLSKNINLPDNSVDVVSAFAFLEHIDYPQEILLDSLRVLKPGGKLIITTPTPLAKSILEFLAFKLNLISQREIAEHQRYFTEFDLNQLLTAKVKPAQIHHQYFEFGLNNLLVVTK